MSRSCLGSGVELRAARSPLCVIRRLRQAAPLWFSEIAYPTTTLQEIKPGWICFTNSTIAMSQQIPAALFSKLSSSRLSSKKKNNCSNDVSFCRTQLAYRRMSFFPRAIPVWKGLPRELVDVAILDCFKSELDSHLKNWPRFSPPPQHSLHPTPPQSH